MIMRRRLALPTALVVLFLFFTLQIRRSLKEPQTDPIAVENDHSSDPPKSQATEWVNPPTYNAVGSDQPRQHKSTSSHPIQVLAQDARREFEEMRKRQSASLDEAVKEYRRRYNMPPPPHFDKWFAFAKENNVQLVDEFDTVYNLIMPFWGLQPKTIRERAKEALGADNFLMGLAIRGHEVTYIQGAQEWQQEATKGMMEKFVQYLPDMDLAFNIHDEPRVVVPHDDMSRLVARAKDVNIPAANAIKSPVNDFSQTSPELSDGLGFDETKVTRFNVFAHQPTWTHARMSCPPTSPSRVLEESERMDHRSEYGYSELGFIYNATASTDVCLSPSLSTSHGFFNVPNSFNIVHDLFPIFSQSKISTFNDLIYPSPWYWYGKVTYDGATDMAWADKKDQLYWRGSTTGGFSRNGGWRHQHRQRFVQKINGPDEAHIMVNKGTDPSPEWHVQLSPRGDHRALIDVRFSHIGQCDPGDCESEINFFNPVVNEELSAAWGYKYLLDMDGNAFSGRFYAFLQSKSLVFKMALFREWHNEWLKPWLHYIPLSLQGDDWLESVRFFAGSAGKKQAQTIAEESRSWANKVVRKEDMEAWFFRLLLEYARVIDDQREVIGFDPASAKQKLPPPQAQGKGKGGLEMA
ncbi:uncharacterized protein F5Z01DRAFT_164037 [Emericellopsis atlantica]|uniref:Glycosyl transferase CAP10 domain-containing protein n=1 Tax=Emericellopsis atlantica TaxID=2614577 RepID=A0A9P7ZKG6_9HYPO|nr:uncharacterized protein F5Z01DRAFT_164037 [Emericellopsis atlantica]KAG9253356.1 hypothetical protein F5Z01DRAFT_164037 [Emericellopsis atlantica]